MRSMLRGGPGSILLIALATPAIAEQIPSAVTPGGSYHISPHQPTAEDTLGDEAALSPHKPAENEMPAGLAIMPHKPAVIENPTRFSLSPHKPDADEMPPVTAAPAPIMPRMPSSSQPVTPNIVPTKQEPANQPQSSPVPAPAGQNQSQQASPPTSAQTTDANRDQKKREEWRRRHLPRPYNGSMQLNPMMGLGAVCMNSSVTICGKTLPVPAGPIGAVANLTTPYPYLPQGFTVQCLAVNGIPSYRIIDATQVTCEVQSCSPSDVTICGAAINIPANVKAGNTLKVPVPASVLANPATAYNMTLRVRCVEGANATAAYRVENEAEISCNQFPCQTSNVRLCDAAIEVPGGSPLGSVLTLTMPPPFTPDQFTVQCLGSMGRQPVYQIIDHAGVGCSRMDGQ